MEQHYEIEITATDIEQGWKCDTYQCPIARAVKRALGPESMLLHVAVGFFSITVGEFQMESPVSVRTFIMAFDEEKPVVPFSFTLDLRRR